MSTTIEGTFRAGKVEFDRPPQARDGDRVLVTFPVDPSPPQDSSMIRFGMFRHEPGQQTTWEDFQEAKRAVYKHLNEGTDADPARG